MSDSNDEDMIQRNRNDIISEKELYEIFEFQYDDLFCKILKITEKSFSSFLKQQVSYHLQIISKNVIPKIFKAYLDLFSKRYKENLKLVQDNYNIIQEKMQNENDSLNYLDITKCFIHCHKCFNIIHKCGKKLVLYDEFVYCIKCNNVYNKNQILLFCPSCKKNYLSKFRKPVFNGNKKFEKLFLTKFKKYHCNTNKEEKIKCLKCSNNLYFRLSQHNSIKENNINIIYCIKCKLKYNIQEAFFKCKICLKNFKGEAKLFRGFSKKKKNILFLIHALLRNKNVLPNYNLHEKICKCDLKTITEYFHKEDQGKLIEGIKNNNKYAVCIKCFSNFKYDEVKWICPECQSEFRNKNDKKINHTNSDYIELNEENEIFESRKIPVFKVNLSKIDSNHENNINYKEKIEENRAKNNDYYNSNININDNNIRVIFNKKENQIKNLNSEYNRIKPKNIFIKQNGTSKNKNIKAKYSMRKSQSKNDIRMKKNKNINNDENFLNSKQKKNNNNIINKSKSKSKNNDEFFKNYENKKEKNNEEEIIKGEDINKRSNTKKEENAHIDTKEIFNQIKDSIYNFEEDSYFILSPDAINKNKLQKKSLIDKNDKNKAKPKHKNTQYFYNDELNKNNLNHGKSFLLSQEDFDNNDLLKESEINNIYGDNINLNRKISSNGNLDNIKLEKNNKRHIRYTKKIYLYNSKNGENIDGNNNDLQPENILTKYMKNNYFNRNQNQNHNLYENNNEYVFSNDSSFQNFDNYEINYQSNNYHQFNLYNFNSENYSIIKLLGKGANGKIYLVSDIQNKQNYAIKSILIDNELDIKMLEEEYNLIYELIYENPELKIVNIYGLEVRRINKYNYFFNVLMEDALSDWEVEIISRKKNNRYYTEEELFCILANLISTLSYLQEKNISHRDLKPQNILYFGNNEYKICDFSEAKYATDKKNQSSNINFNDLKQTIRGTQLYMSPILFKALKYKPDSLTKYNSFKSDVFSLGLCFLHASSLDSNILYKIREIVDMKKIIDIVNNYLGLRYSQNYINFLLYMLEIDENNRPDFIELNSWLLFDTN